MGASGGEGAGDDTDSEFAGWDGPTFDDTYPMEDRGFVPTINTHQPNYSAENRARYGTDEPGILDHIGDFFTGGKDGKGIGGTIGRGLVNIGAFAAAGPLGVGLLNVGMTQAPDKIGGVAPGGKSNPYSVSPTDAAVSTITSGFGFPGAAANVGYNVGVGNFNLPGDPKGDLGQNLSSFARNVQDSTQNVQGAIGSFFTTDDDQNQRSPGAPFSSNIGGRTQQ
jgi:hypothetical protein